MSKLRAILPLVMVTGLGVVNGIYVFGPPLEEQQLEKLGVRKEIEPKDDVVASQEKALRDAEAQASRSAARDSALQPKGSQSSWWSSSWLWSTGKSSDRGVGPTQESPAARNLGDDSKSKES